MSWSLFWITEQGYPKLPDRVISRSVRALARRGYSLLSAPEGSEATDMERRVPNPIPQK